ncbi:uncharacterized protein [Dysidea avara]|uniref:uncharacterized protein isoform X2 n=1 Tax=Dysidea avara TaxID=196820 RepID=UPI00332A8A66
MSTTDSGIITTEFSTDTDDTRDDTLSPSPHNDNEQCKEDMDIPVDSNSVNHDMEHNETKDTTVSHTTHRFTSESGESTNGLTEVQVIKVLRFRLVMSLLVIICFVIMLYQIPVILYYTDTPGQGSDSGGYDYEDCSVSPSALNISSLLEKCDKMLMINITNTDFPECELDFIEGLWSIFDLGTGSPCTKDALSFFCNATLLLCNGNSSSVDLTEECEEVRDNKCASEWRIVENFYNRSVPDCTSYTYSEDVNLTSSKAPSLPCPNGFDHFCGSTCLPVCAGDNLYSGGIIGVIAGVITLIAFYYYRQKVMQFPQIYIVFNAIIVELAACLEYLPIFGQSALLCSNRNALVAANKPTNFCQAQGFLLHFIYNCFMGFWCFHLFHLFFGLVFPFKMKMLLDSSSRRRRVLMTEVVTVVLLSSVPPIVTISVSKYSLAAYYCFPTPIAAVFYGHLLPLLFLFCIGLILLLISLRLLRRKHHFMSKNITVSKVFCLGYSIPEVKLTMLFCYYTITFFMYFCAVIAYLQEVDEYNANIGEYIFCSAGGFKEECEIHRVRAERSTVLSTVLIIISLLLYTLINIIHLLYVVHVPTMLDSIRKFCNKF